MPLKRKSSSAMFATPLISFLLKHAWYLFREIRSHQWKRVPATIVSCISDNLVGGPGVTLTYEIVSQGDTLRGTTSVSFVLYESAAQYAQGFEKNQRVIVRVDPANPSHTLFVDSDQKS
jgi:hypothetical protein